MALDNVSEKEAFRATDLMNNRPRKCLGCDSRLSPFPNYDTAWQSKCYSQDFLPAFHAN
jgi:hypothetical protein